MLTGQGQPVGQLPWYTKVIVVVTAVLATARAPDASRFGEMGHVAFFGIFLVACSWREALKLRAKRIPVAKLQEGISCGQDSCFYLCSSCPVLVN